ncbi:hypothetical protein F2Q68_00024513 [Brassica cretica]|uniref:Uncharacterized protein n=1 Tax=Brassica cretica TaxID=69181 RepID=A0A8S9IEI9_BRACR|nr:hypothetical protein F2Q68_00024513 [Brassica cretica]
MKLRRILGSVSSLATEKLSSSSSSYSSRCPSRQIFTASQRNAGGNHSEALPGKHIEWASLGSVRNSRFASGFSPLKPKPLDSIMDLDRAKTKSPEELTSIWDDNVEDYEGIIKMSKTNCIDDGELGVRVQAIRGLPLFCKDSPDIISKIVDVLVQLLYTEEPVERDAVHKALMSLIRQDPKASLTALFTHAGVTPTTDDQIREKVLNFIRDKATASLAMASSDLRRPPKRLRTPMLSEPLHAKVPSFIGDTNMNLSWKEATKPLASAATTTIGGKRPANSNNGSGNSGAAKKRRGSNGMPNQLVNKAFEGISSYGGGRGGNRSQGRRGGGGRRGRGRGRGHW